MQTTTTTPAGTGRANRDRRRRPGRRGLSLAKLPVTALGLTLGAAPAASAAEPSTVTTTIPPYAQTLEGADSPCPFPVTFTGAGSLRISTFVDSTGTPVRQTYQGSLDHTLVSAWQTLESAGPATVHVDLRTGDTITTGLQYRFRAPGSGFVLAAAGRMTVGPDGTTFTGLERVDPALCDALAP